jgi:hypothetical protein
MRKLLLSFAATVALLSPALAGDDALDDVRFGAAIAAVFDDNCRPIESSALSAVAIVLGGMPELERAEMLERAQAYLAKAGRKAFCDMNEPLVRQIEAGESATLNSGLVS